MKSSSTSHYPTVWGIERGLELDEQVWNRILLASSALPGIFPPVEIEGEMYSDGGVEGDNVQARALRDRGIRNAIVVHLKPEAEEEPQEWPDMKLIQLFPSESLGGFEDGTLDFRPESALWRRKLGLQDARRMLAGLKAE